MASLEEQLVLTDHLEVHLLELPRYTGAVDCIQMACPKEQWACFLRHAAELDIAEIGQLFPNPAFVEAGGILEMISKTTEERLRYEMRVKALRDQKWHLEAARSEGLAAGLEQGREEGRLIGRIQTLQELLGEVVSSSDELRTWELDTLARLNESLQARLRERADS